MSDEYASEAIIRWDEHGQVQLLWEMEGHVYGISVAPEIYDQMLLDVESFDEVRDQTPLVLQLLTWDEDGPGFQKDSREIW